MLPGRLLLNFVVDPVISEVVEDVLLLRLLLAEYDDVGVDDFSNLLRMSLWTPEEDTLRTTGRRPVVRSGMT
jgi:hypothetical protein